MAAATISSAEDFLRSQYAEPIEGRLPLAPTFKAILNTLLTITATSVGKTEISGAKAVDGYRFTVRLALRVLSERYSHEVLMLILSLDDRQ